MRARVRVCEFSILDGCSQLARSYLRSHDLQYLSPCIFGALDSREYGTSAAKTSEQAVSCSCVAVVLQLCCSCVAVVLQLCCSCVAERACVDGCMCGSILLYLCMMYIQYVSRSVRRWFGAI